VGLRLLHVLREVGRTNCSESGALRRRFLGRNSRDCELSGQVAERGIPSAAQDDGRLQPAIILRFGATFEVVGEEVAGEVLS
jgi:hypothetical protein